MDKQVIAAMARWPDVPAVYGWLSLTESGQWRLHPDGGALQDPTARGEEITSPQILAFMNRNYSADELGQWYFQNGPQRVYVRLDAAPFIAHTTIDAASGRLKLRTHTGLDIREVRALHLDETGRLYARTDRGAVLIAGRDLPGLLDALQAAPANDSQKPQEAAGPPGAATSPLPDGGTDAHDALARCLDTGATILLQSRKVQGFPATPVLLHRGSRDALEATLCFRRLPLPPEGVETSPSHPGKPALG